MIRVEASLLAYTADAEANVTRKYLFRTFIMETQISISRPPPQTAKTNQDCLTFMKHVSYVFAC